MLNSKKFVVLGIDPGLANTGWGIVEKEGCEIRYIDCGVIQTNSADRLESRLTFLYFAVEKLIKNFSPTEVSMEEVFVNSNPKTSEKLIMARTAIFVCFSNHGYLINEYKPNEIKKNITGHGHASKNQIHVMVQKILNIAVEKSTKNLDSIDAVAISLCHAFAI